jgi:hypothetical protein
MESSSWLDDARESVRKDLDRLLAAESRQVEELAETRAGLGRARGLLEALDAYCGGEPGNQAEPEARERADLILAAASGGAEGEAAERETAERAKLLDVMRGVPGRNAWRPIQVAERLGHADTAAVRLLMDRMVADGELVKSSSRRYQLPPEAAEVPGEPPAM